MMIIIIIQKTKEGKKHIENASGLVNGQSIPNNQRL